MFIKLKDGRVINALDISIVEPFNAEASAPSPYKERRQEAEAQIENQYGQRKREALAELAELKEQEAKGGLSRLMGIMSGSDAKREKAEQTLADIDRASSHIMDPVEQDERHRLRQREDYLRRYGHFHSRVIHVPKKDANPQITYLEETPEEFYETATRQLQGSGFKFGPR